MAQWMTGWRGSEFVPPHFSRSQLTAFRYHGQSVLDCIHRNLGIEQWQALMDPNQPDPGLEKALGAFDMFVLDRESGGLDEV